MDEDQYLSERVLDQEEWFDRKSQWNQAWHKRLGVVQIVAASTIPFLAGMQDAIQNAAWIIGFLGVLIAVSSAVGSMYKFQENWIQYRTTGETLKHERYLYQTHTAPYDGDERFKLLVQNVEGLLARENTKWAQYVTRSQDNDGEQPADET